MCFVAWRRQKVLLLWGESTEPWVHQIALVAVWEDLFSSILVFVWWDGHCSLDCNLLVYSVLWESLNDAIFTLCRQDSWSSFLDVFQLFWLLLYQGLVDGLDLWHLILAHRAVGQVSRYLIWVLIDWHVRRISTARGLYFFIVISDIVVRALIVTFLDLDQVALAAWYPCACASILLSQCRSK